MKINNHFVLALACILSLIIATTCKDSFLDKKPYGTTTESTLGNKDGLNALLIGAYSYLKGGSGGGFVSSWMSVASQDDARLGCEDGATIENCFLYDATNAYINERWVFLYSAVQACNDVLRILPDATDLTEDERTQLTAEARFLRGIYYLYLAMSWKNVPWIDETITYSEQNYLVPNTDPIYPRIEEDFEYAANHLTETKTQVGRGNKWAAKCFLVKAYMFQKKFSEAKTLLEDIIANGRTSNDLKYGLLDKYGDNFRTETKNGSEGVFVVQMSVNDGSDGANGNPMDYFNGPYGSPATCCYGCYAPYFDLIDAYQTDDLTGLPLIDTYQLTPVKNDQGISSSEPFTPHEGPLDARLDWCVGRRGIPFLDWGVHPGMAWIRSQYTDGPYSAIKNICWQARVETDREAGSSATNTPLNLIRFADVLLWAAECEIEVGTLSRAEEYVNQVRERAANPQGFVYKYMDDNDPLRGFSTTPAANYKVGLYTGQFEANGKTYARKAVRFERRLELACEHQRYFDLLRYDGLDFDVAEWHNRVMQREGSQPGFNPSNNYKQAMFVKGKNELFPIPQEQIDMSVEKNGTSVLTQNPGWR